MRDPAFRLQRVPPVAIIFGNLAGGGFAVIVANFAPSGPENNNQG